MEPHSIADATENCLLIHIYREENMVAEALSKFGHMLGFCKFLDSYDLPDNISLLIVKDGTEYIYHKNFVIPLQSLSFLFFVTIFLLFSIYCNHGFPHS